MKITQGTFAFLPDLNDEQISKQVQYCIDNDWAVAVEYTNDPHPRNTYWEMWDLPMFDIKDAAGIMYELKACRKVHSKDNYIRLTAFDNSHGVESIKLSFIVDRPKVEEPGFRLIRQEVDGRNIRYTTQAYSTDKPSAERYK